MKQRKFNASPINQMTRGMMGMAMGGMIAGASTKALGTMGADPHIAGGISAATSMMPAMGSIVGLQGVVGMASQMMPEEPRRKRR